MNKHYNEWFMDQLIETTILHCKAGDLKAPLVPTMFDEHFKTHLYFITVTFTPVHKNSDLHIIYGYDHEICNKDFQDYYKQICRNVIQSGWKRKKAEQPFTIYALDAEGSKAGSIDWTSAQNVHVHGLMLFHPNTIGHWKRLDPNSIIPESSRIDDVLAVAYDPEKASFENLVSYCTKAIRPTSDQHNLFDILPNGKNSTRWTCHGLVPCP